MYEWWLETNLSNSKQTQLSAAGHISTNYPNSTIEHQNGCLVTRSNTHMFGMD